MEASTSQARAEQRLSHDQVQRLMQNFGKAGIINLDTSIRSLMEPVAGTIKPGDGTVSLHIVCCNEYGFVTP
jgi:hypothetical protein